MNIFVEFLWFSVGWGEEPAGHTNTGKVDLLPLSFVGTRTGRFRVRTCVVVAEERSNSTHPVFQTVQRPGLPPAGC